MAVNRLMDITMTSALFLLILLVPATGARYLSGEAIETRTGVTATDGISPLPTEAPGFNGIPKELRNRAIQPTLSSPLSNWCGFVDGDYQNILSCAPGTSCMLQSNFYNECGCTSRNTELCFTFFPTTCVDHDIYTAVATLGDLTGGCKYAYFPYCQTYSFSGMTSFGCDSTRFPGIHSWVPVGAFYSSLNENTHITTSSSSPVSTSTRPVKSSEVKSSELSTPARAGIGIGVGLAILIAAAAIAFCLWQKRKRERASTTAGGAGPAMAQTNNIPQGYQSAVQPVQQYQPQLDNTKLPEPGDVPPYSPAPVYTNGGQHRSSAPITPYDLTNSPNTASKYPNPTITTASPLSSNASHQTPQQQNTAPSWEYPVASPISTFSPGGGPNIHHPEIPLNHPEMGVGQAEELRTSTPWDHYGQGAGVNNPSPPGNHSELSGEGKAGADYPDPPKNHSELGP